MGNEVTREVIIDTLEDVVNQACRLGMENYLHSGALSANAEAMLLLEELGRLTIIENYGRMVTGYWDDEPAPKKESKKSS